METNGRGTDSRDQSVGELVSQLSEQTSRLIRQEMALGQAIEDLETAVRRGPERGTAAPRRKDRDQPLLRRFRHGESVCEAPLRCVRLAGTRAMPP